MSDHSDFERRLARDLNDLAGPPLPVDAALIVRMVATTRGSQGPDRRRGLRLLAVAISLTAVGGVLILGDIAPQPASSPADVGAMTTAAPSHRAVLDGTGSVDPGYRVTRVPVGDDPGVVPRFDRGHGPFDGSVHVGPDGQVLIVDGDRFTSLTDSREGPSPGSGFADLGNEIAFGSDGRLWTTYSGLWSFNDGVWTRDPTFGDRVVSGIETSADGELWVRWCSGRDFDHCRRDVRISRGMPDSWEAIDIPSAFAGFDVGVATDDHFALGGTSDLWMPAIDADAAGDDGRTAIMGLNHFDGEGWQQVDPVGMAPYAAGGNVDIGADGTLWTYFVKAADRGTEASAVASLARLADGVWNVFPISPDFLDVTGRPGASVRSMSAAGDGSVWIADDACTGLTRFDGTTWSRILDRSCVLGLDAAPDGTAWALVIEPEDRAQIAAPVTLVHVETAEPS